jgi:hypothetical protein
MDSTAPAEPIEHADGVEVSVSATVRDRQGNEHDGSIEIQLGTIRESDGTVSGGATATLAEVAEAHDRAAERQAWEEHERREAELAVRRLAPRQRERRLDRRLGSGRPRARARRASSSASARGDPDLPPRSPRASGPRHISRALADAGYESPFDRPVDRILAGLRRHADDAYRLIPGERGGADRWLARCPFHPDVGFSLTVTEAGGLSCQAGCPEWAIRYALVDDPDRQKTTEAAARVIVWAQNWKRSA